MWRVRAGVCAAAALFCLAQAAPADARDKSPPVAPATAAPTYDWTGFYAGVNLGAAWGSFDPTTSTQAGSYLTHARDIAAVNAAGAQTINPLGFAGGGQAGYNVQSGRTLLGFEAELDYLHLLGAANSNAVRYPAGGSGFFNSGFRLNQFVISSYADANWLLTLRPRAGVTVDNWLFYLTGGLAVTELKGQFLFTDGNAAGAVIGAVQEANAGSVRAGYALGGGIETGLNDRLSLKAEYLYVHFGTLYGHEVSSNFVSSFTPPSPQAFTQSMDLSASILRLGLNYRFGAAAAGNGNATFWPPRSAVSLSDWQFDVGTRLWFSSGKIGAPQPLLGNAPLPSTINSRLTYINLDGISGETFGRADHASGVFVKGYVGAGAITHGDLIDEDFPGFGGAYSNTVSPVSGSLGYATLDLGYTFLKGPGGRLGAFVGYNYFRQHLDGFGCNQAAGDTTCVGVDAAFQVFNEDDHFNSLRVGLSTDFWLTDALKFSADAAYVPYTTFRGQDDHNLRQLLLPEMAPTGNGVMLESVLNYAVTRNWNVGVGGRYWALNTNTGSVWFDALGLALPTTPQLARYNTERYGVFLQTDYHWGDERPAEAARAAPVAVARVNWSGLYLGGYVGGGWSDTRWSDPFGDSTSAGLTNIAGFGDTIHSTGPLGGGHIGADWQSGAWIAGIQSELAAANIRGENTCFSGIGGVNCQLAVDTIATAGGRFGYAFNRSLLYVKAGAAWTRSTYTLWGDTNGNPSGGFQELDKSAHGWMAGVGLQYALADNWSTLFEYEHIGLGTVTVAFPAVSVLNGQMIGVKQSIDTLRLGIDRKFDLPTVFGAGG